MQPRSEGLIPKKSPVGEPRSVISVAVRMPLRPLVHMWRMLAPTPRPIEEGSGRTRRSASSGLGTREANAIRPCPTNDGG